MSEIIYPVAVFMVKAGQRVLRLRTRIVDESHLPRVGGAVVASNHVSYLDPFAIGLAADKMGRVARFLSTREHFDHPVYGAAMRSMRHIAVGSGGDGEAYRAATAALDAGELIGVFPEATIARSFTVQRLRTGAARLAAGCGVPLVPVAVWGSQRLWTTHHRELDQRGLPLTVIVGEPMFPAADDDPDYVTIRLRDRMKELLDRAQREYPESGTGQWWQPRHLGGSAPTPAEAVALDAAENDARDRRQA
ncbi:lysophospholipid acyltransferase family protein [Nocardia gamkensis]|uniref:lysophospholipid acyltransferase family protein n=1 Tax=Nocardia gamkensis TaxID=352869 RepID=UPI0036E7B010